LKISDEPTKVCKICFKKVSNNSLFNLFFKDCCLCSECQNKLIPIFKKFKVDGVNALAIYEYDDEFKQLIYQFKGCYDIELSPIFLQRYKGEIKVRYRGFIVVPAPSYYEDDEKREFNHVIEIFKELNMPIEKLICKANHFKQAEHKSKDRTQISECLCLLKNEDLKDKKVLFVDDVFTTGNTARTCIELLRELHPKKIEVLVMCKTKDLH